MVVDSVQAFTSKLAYGHALNQLFGFAAGGRSLAPSSGPGGVTWTPSPPPIVNVWLAAVRKLVAEARKSGMLSNDEAQTLTDVPNVCQQETRLGNWLTKKRAKLRGP